MSDLKSIKKVAVLTDISQAAPETSTELRERIGDLAFEVTQHAATELPFSGEYDDFFERGIYVDIVSGEVLFTSKDKFDSGCGWPAFSKPISEDAITKNRDFSHGATRIEVRSKKANSHLGHVFNDGPNGSKRYCINSNALRFIPENEVDDYLKKLNNENK